MTRLIEAVVLAMCSPWTSVALASVSSLALGAALVLRASGE
jgi:hypothetical protein